MADARDDVTVLAFPASPRYPDSVSSRSFVPRSLLTWALPLVAALAVVSVYHHQTLRSGLDLVQSVENDSLFIGYVLEHWHRVLGGHAAWHSPQMYHPVQQTLGNSDALVGFAVPYHLLRSCGLDPFVALNLTTMLLTFLAFLSCYLLLRRFFGLSMLTCCVGAAFFAVSHPRFTQQVHVQLQFLFLVPLVLWAMLYVLRDGARASTARLFAVVTLAGVMLALQLATAIYVCWFLALYMVLFLLTGLAVRSFRLQVLALLKTRWYVLLAATVLPALLALPVLSLYLRTPIRWSYEAIVQQIPFPSNLLWMSRENAIWGALLDGLRPAGSDHGLGVGVVFTAAWVILTALALYQVVGRLLPRSVPEDPGDGELQNRQLICLLLVTSLILFLLSIRYGESTSPWWLVYHASPGAGGIRVVSRFVLVLTLPVALAGALGLDRCLAAARRLGGWKAWSCRGLVAGVMLLGLVEQTGTMVTYSGSKRLQRFVQLTQKVDRSCPVFLFRHGPLAESRKATFSDEAYLDANPDIRQQWKGTAWDHYQKHGRHQCRFVCERAIWTAIVVHLEAMWVSALTGVPTLNGYSARHPEGWPFHNLCCDGFDRGYREWIQRHRIVGRVCVVKVTF